MLNRKVLRPLAGRLLKSALRRLTYADKSREDSKLETVLYLEEKIYSGLLLEWQANLQGVDLFNPLIRCEVLLILRSELPKALEQVEDTLKSLGIEADEELESYALTLSQTISPEYFLVGAKPS